MTFFFPLNFVVAIGRAVWVIVCVLVHGQEVQAGIFPRLPLHHFQDAPANIPVFGYAGQWVCLCSLFSLPATATVATLATLGGQEGIFFGVSPLTVATVATVAVATVEKKFFGGLLILSPRAIISPPAGRGLP